MLKDFPKLHSPFVRKEIDGRYIVTPEIDPDYSWVFESGVRASDKIDGTNICIRIKNGNISEIFNRTNEKNIFNIHKTNWEAACFEGIAQAIKRGWCANWEDGDHYGELIGELFNGNPHQITGNIFIPFEVLSERCHWHTWVQNKYPKDFYSISEWFKTLPSIFNQKFKFPEVLAEGLVFYHPDGRMAKLRRDMFPWHEGRGHKK
ncbi:MAG TPA: hypothetical protein DCS28_03475 [Candidatus Moranbacteria bacterium]|nr:hypothetical protein [Candidatus Moranbacteria bacterium]HAT75072.1 hypothetical protein [Candidatus Moranbacteria bacterium]